MSWSKNPGDAEGKTIEEPGWPTQNQAKHAYLIPEALSPGSVHLPRHWTMSETFRQLVTAEEWDATGT